MSGEHKTNVRNNDLYEIVWDRELQFDITVQEVPNNGYQLFEILHPIFLKFSGIKSQGSVS